VDDLLSSRVLGALLAVGAVFFWYEAPVWAREKAGQHLPFRRAERRLDPPSPDPRTVRMATIVLRAVAAGCFATGVLQAVGVITGWR
jgi:hypothetical protein